MSTPNATTSHLQEGLTVNSSRRLNFKFNGRSYQGVVGDTLASALLANGVIVVGRSFKYRRRRGIVSDGAEEPNAIVQLGSGATTVPNIRATQVMLYEGLEATSVNKGYSLDFDLRAIIRLAGRFMPPGFYYKTFMSPKKLWPFYERLIRLSAGLGEIPKSPDPDLYDSINAHCDILVVGGGIAGLSAALTAGLAGARVIITEQQPLWGGALLGRPETVVGLSSKKWIEQVIDRLKGMKEVKLLPNCCLFGAYDHHFYTACETRYPPGITIPEGEVRERVWKIRARQVIHATGAIERPLLYKNNDLPGIMLAGAVSAYINRWDITLSRHAVVFTNNDSGYRAASDLVRSGASVVVVDPRAASETNRYAKWLDQNRVEILNQSWITEARGTLRVRSVIVKSSGEGNQQSKFTCDLLAVSGGWNPVLHLYAYSGGKPLFDEQRGCFVPNAKIEGQQQIGAANGSFSLAACLNEGVEAGIDALFECGYSASVPETTEVEVVEEQPILPFWRLAESGGEQFIDLQNDTKVADIELAVAEGYRSIEHIKRYTLLGFGTDQGKMGNIVGMAVAAGLLEQTIPQTGTTTFRPPYTPVTFGAIAGRHVGPLFDVVRKTAFHSWHCRHGAEFEDVGQWRRPWYYPREGETMHQAVNRECLTARNQVAMIDASTLGKIDIQGPDAVTFLDRIYTNGWGNLKPGRCRYGLMLGEDGMVMDDGVTTCLGPNHYLMTTTTGGAARVLGWMERWLQTEWPELKVYFTSVTDHWATISVSGPFARKTLEQVCEQVDLSSASFPFLSFREGVVAGVPARVFRISFSGELGFEINVNANAAQGVWDAIWEAGQEYGITAYGTEAMHVLRAEKGFIIVGQDTDGSVTPIDLGMNWIVSKKKDFIGRRSLARADTKREDRKQLVGLLTSDPARVLPEGAQLVANPDEPLPATMIGHVTSSYWSENIGRSIALALVRGGHQKEGQRIYVRNRDGETIAVNISSSVFFDPEGERQNV